MKVEHLFEMSATKLCPKCHKSMAANHYWYKGGWKCKKAKEEAATAHPAAPVLAAAKKSIPAPPRHIAEPNSVEYDREAERRSDAERAYAAEEKRKNLPQTIDDVKEGDYIGFKYDIEQGAKVLSVKRDHYGKKVFVVRAFQGGYVDNQSGSILEIPAEDAWLD